MKSRRRSPEDPAGPTSAEPESAEGPALPRWRRLLRGRGLLTALGTAVVAIALAGPLFVPRDSGGDGVGPWLPMGRILEPVHGHHRHRHASDGSDHVRPATDPSTRTGGARSPWQGGRPTLSPQRDPAPRPSIRPRRTRLRSGQRGLVTSWRHLQCRVLHRHC